MNSHVSEMRFHITKLQLDLSLLRIKCQII